MACLPDGIKLLPKPMSTNQLGLVVFSWGNLETITQATILYNSFENDTFKVAAKSSQRPLRLDCAYMGEWTESSLVQQMAWYKQSLSPGLNEFKKMHLKMSAKWRPFCLCLNVSTQTIPGSLWTN